MKKRILEAINGLLKTMDAKMVRRSTEMEKASLTMESMIQRLAERAVSVGTVIDIGASDGNWSVSCMKYFPDARFLAIEPLQERMDSLAENKIRYVNFDYAVCLAGEGDGEEIALQVTDDLDGSTVDGRGSGNSRFCISRTIDSLVAEKSLPGPYLLKFDTHGYELPILSGSSKVLRDASAIIMETYNFQLTPNSLRFHEMCSHLENIGFRCADVADPMLRLHDHAFWQMDFLFLRDDSDLFLHQSYQ